MRYMLDTDICIYIIKKRPEGVLHRLKQLTSEDACLSFITYAELCYGAEKSNQRPANRDKVSELRSVIPVIPFDENASQEYGLIRALLEKKGLPIGGNDLFIAAHAKALGLTIVTNNVREFFRVPGLQVERWS